MNLTTPPDPHLASAILHAWPEMMVRMAVQQAQRLPADYVPPPAASLNSGPWGEIDQQHLALGWLTGVPLSIIARDLNRSPYSVIRKVQSMHLHRP